MISQRWHGDVLSNLTAQLPALWDSLMPVRLWIIITSYVPPTEPAHPRSHGSRYCNQRNQKEDTYVQSERAVHSISLSYHFRIDDN